MEFDFLKPLDNEILQFIKEVSSQQLGSKVVFHTEKDFPDLNKIKIAIIGVLENRGDVNQTEEVDLSHIRKELYGLFPGNWNASIADLGNIHAGNSITDTHFALRKVVSSLIKKKIIPIIIGGSQDLTYALYRAYDDLEQMVNLVSIDNKFDFGKEREAISASSYLTKIIIEEPNNLFNFSNIGFQTYYNSQEEIDLIDKLYFEAYRLGDISNNIALAEPVFRDADLVNIDLASVKSSDSGNFTSFVPNGFSGKEICALSRYAGISDKVSLFGIFNHNNSAQESVLIAQIIWYFIEGFHYRSN
jgi:arginase family enzyme